MPNASPIHTQVAAVRRRLFLQELVGLLVSGWLIAALTAALWLLAEPFLRMYVPAAVRTGLPWAGVALAFLATTVAAVVVACRRTPSPTQAALAFDERFGLRERVTTALSLEGTGLLDSPAGVALRADVDAALQRLQRDRKTVGGAFPLAVPWGRTLLVSACVPGLALLAVLYNGRVTATPPVAAQAAATIPAETRSEVEEKVKEVKPLRFRKPDDPIKAERLKELEDQQAELERILGKERSTPDELRERLKELNTVEEALKKEERARAEKEAGLREQLANLDRLKAKDKPKPGEEAKDEPVKSLEDALARAEMKEAKQEVERLKKKLKDEKTAPEEKEKLRKEMKDLSEKVERLSRKEDEKEQLRKLERDGKIDRETAEREIEKLDREARENGGKDLKDVADKLKKAEEKLKEAGEKGEKGDKSGSEAAEKEAEDALGGLGEKLDDLDREQQEREDMENQLQRLNDAKEAMKQAESRARKPANDGTGDDQDARRLSRDPGKEPGEEGSDKDGKGEGGDKDGKTGEKGGKDGSGKDGGGKEGAGKAGKRPGTGGSGVGAGKRPVAKDGPELGGTDVKEEPPFDPKGRKVYGGATAGQGFQKKPTAALAGDIRQASQEAPEAIEVQRIPKGARDIAKGYFKSLGGQAPAPPPAPPK